MHTPTTTTTTAPKAQSKANDPGQAALPCPSAPLNPPSAVVRSSELLQGQRTLAITHNGAVYRLQATRQGKLILTK